MPPRKRARRRTSKSDWTVFVSHAGADTWVARQIVLHLKEAGAKPFLDESHIAVGEDFEEGADITGKKEPQVSKYDVFLSYPAKDRDWARQVALRLRKRGLTVWFDEEQIKPGDEWGQKTLDGLTHSANVVFLVDAEAAKSNNVALELGVALGQGKRIIPVVEEGVTLEQIPGPLRRRQRLLRSEPVVNVKEIAETIGTARGALTAEP